MSVSSFSLLDTEFSGSEEGERSYMTTWEAVCSSVNDGPRVIYDFVKVNIPVFTSYSIGNENDSYCFARRPSSIKRRAREKHRSIWRVMIEFTNRPLDIDNQSDFDDPLSKPWKVSGSFVRATKVATKDRNGDPIVNSSDEPVIPAPEIDDSRDTIIVTGNTLTIDLQQRAEARDKVNSTTIWGLTSRKVKLSQWAFNTEWTADYRPYVSHRFEFEINLDKWDFVHIDQGFRIKAGQAAGKQLYTTLMDDEDQPLRQARLLDGNGQLLAAAANPVEITDEIIDEYDFTQLPVPNPLPVPIP